jgi:hypothetical protein
MNTHNPDDQDHDESAVVIPLPHSESMILVAGQEDSTIQLPEWWYDQDRTRAAGRRYRGHVRLVRGPEAEQLRSELAQVVHELLSWASQDYDRKSIEDGEAV